MIISRINPTVSFGEIFKFIINLLKPTSSKFSLDIITNFENKFSEKILPSTQCIAVSKPRVAFYYILKNLQIDSSKKKVLISAIHVADFVNMIRLAGFEPVVVDLEPHSYCLSLTDLKKKSSSDCAALLVTHLSGYSNDIEKIVTIVKPHGIELIEDCSQAYYSCAGSNKLGSFGVAAFWSMSFLKSVSTFVGGVICTKNLQLADKIRAQVNQLPPQSRIELFSLAFKNLIFKIVVSPGIFDYLVFPSIRIVRGLGDFFAWFQKTNRKSMYRNTMPQEFLVKLSWQQAILGMSQLETFELREQKRSKFGKNIYEKLSKIQCPFIPKMHLDEKNSFWLFPLIVPNPKKLSSFLAAKGIDSSPMLLSVISQEKSLNIHDETPNAIKLKSQTIFLPMFAGLSDEKIDKIFNVIESYSSSRNESLANAEV